MIELRVNSPEETQAIAAHIASAVQPGDIILISGDLGAGKTTFTKGFGRALGITETIASPTFILVRSYDSDPPLHHVDIYRLDQLQEIIDLGLAELIDDGGVAVIEWGEQASPVLPADFLVVSLAMGNEDDERQVSIHAVGESWPPRLPDLELRLSEWSVA